jgi:hypothetical protein
MQMRVTCAQSNRRWHRELQVGKLRPDKVLDIRYQEDKSYMSECVPAEPWMGNRCSAEKTPSLPFRSSNVQGQEIWHFDRFLYKHSMLASSA